jgi:CheY-like chemotaxis protein
MSVFLPALEAPSRESSAPAPEALPVGQGELILVVDDEAAVREAIRRNLQEFGYQVLLAREGGEALQLWAQERGRVRAVLTDVMMPGVDGPLLIQALRREAPTLPVVAMSGLTIDPPPGADLLLQKPFRMQDLLRTIHDLVSRGERS